MKYRLALDVGSTSIGWAIFRLDSNKRPYAIIRSGVRIFSDGRNPKDGSSLAVTRRMARSARRRRDRLLKRKSRMINALIKHGFFPSDLSERKSLERLDPYKLRAEGLDRPLTAFEYGRALFHINQRRGFKSNRKTDSMESSSSLMKAAILNVHDEIKSDGFRTVGEWLYRRKQNGMRVRARLNEDRIANKSGSIKLNKYYDLYIDRSMIEHEFDTLWDAQQNFNKGLFNEEARKEIKDILLFQRSLRPVDPGRCTFYPSEKRAPLALPSVQRFRIYQEVNNLRWLNHHLVGESLNIDQRDTVISLLEKSNKKTFTQIRKHLNFSSTAIFNLEDEKRSELRGNNINVILAKKEFFGASWYDFKPEMQDEIVLQMLDNESEKNLVEWLNINAKVSFDVASKIARIKLPNPGYSSLSLKAIKKILPFLQDDVRSYDKAVVAAGFDHHSSLGPLGKGDIYSSLPYYGKVLQRHVGFGTGDVNDTDEKHYGRISNPTVHIGLNQLRLLINELLKEYGHPTQVVVELARNVKQSQEQKRKTITKQAKNKKRNDVYRKEIAEILGIDESRVGRDLIHKRILWEELSPDIANRCCPYTGEQISLSMLFESKVEIEHILPFSKTLDNSLNNKTIAMARANRIKGNQTPWEAFGKRETVGFNYEDILRRASVMAKSKRYRFAPDAMEQWLMGESDFLARSLNDTQYLSRIAKQYLEYICLDTWVIPGYLTGFLRAKYGLNNADILGWGGRKNRNDHRHHAVDACVIGITDRLLLNKISQTSAITNQEVRTAVIKNIPLPWETYRDHVKRAVNNIWVSHKPDHSYERSMHNDTAYSLLGDGMVGVHKVVDGKRKFKKEKLSVIPITSKKSADRHGYLPNGLLRPYKGYKGDSNYCIEIVRTNRNSSWVGRVVSTYEAYQVIRKLGKDDGWKVLRDPFVSLSNESLVMRLMLNDIVRMEHNNAIRTMRIVTIKSSGQLLFADIHESNVDARNRNKDDAFRYVSKTAGSLFKSNARRVTISPSGRLRDGGFKP